MNHGSLFSGIGGFDLASEWMGWNNVFQVENDEFCQKVLIKNFPNVKRYKDIKDFDGTKYRGTIDIISGGFPCQPFSQAGKRKGTSDDRYLWPEMLRVISEVKPTFVVGENVAGLLSMENGKTLEGIFTDLEDEGYMVESFIIPACATGAWHRRDRIWIVAYCCSTRGTGKTASKINRCSRNNGREATKILSRQEDVSDTNNTQTTRQRKNGRQIYRKPESERFNSISKGWWSTEPNVGRVAHGIPSRVDRLKGLGNAVVPQVVYEIFKAIECLK